MLFGVVFFLLVYFLPPSVQAITYNTVTPPQEVTQLVEFSIALNISDLEQENYYIKFRGGSDYDDGQTCATNTTSCTDWLGDTSPWVNYPTITPNAGNWSGTLVSRFKDISPIGGTSFKISLRKVGTETNVLSQEVAVQVLPAPTPSPTPTSSPSPSSTPTKDPTPTPSRTPTPIPTITLTPSPKPTTKPTSTPSVAISPTSKPEQTIKPTPTITLSPSPYLTSTPNPSPIPTDPPLIPIERKLPILGIVLTVIGLIGLGVTSFFALRRVN